jgi:flagellar FliL protein
MADNQLEDDGVQVVKTRQGQGIVKILLIVVTVIVLVAGTIGTTLYFAGVVGGNSGSGSPDSSSTRGDSTETGSTDSSAMKKEPIYYAFDPAFIVNFNDGNNIRYLQVTLEVMTYNQHTVEDLERHMPVIRNNLIMMFSSLNYDVLSSVAGKRKLQEEALAEIRSILKEKTGKEGVEEVYFTGFVMQ